jgi:AhpC/TSA family
MKRTLLSILMGLTLIVGLALGQEKKDEKPAPDTADGPQVGQPAPDFDLPWADQNGAHTKRDEWIKLSALRGSNVILAFYAADWTGG